MVNKNIIVSLILLASLTMAIIGYLILPQTLIMQITIAGEAGNTMPKLLGLGIPLLICIISAVLYYLNESRKKYLFTAIVGVLIYLFIFVVNL